MVTSCESRTGYHKQKMDKSTPHQSVHISPVLPVLCGFFFFFGKIIIVGRHFLKPLNASLVER